MVTTNKAPYTGSQIPQNDMDIIGYIASEQDGCKFQPNPNQTEQELATFTNTHQPFESNNVDWKKVELNRTWQQITDPESDTGGSFSNIISLYGIMHDGSPELIGEIIETSIPSTETTEPKIFDLDGSAGEAPVKQTIETTTAGKIKLKLPMRLKNYDSVTLKHSPYDPNWPKNKILPVTSPTDYSYTNYVIGPITVNYVSGMNSDFSDLRYVVWDNTLLQFVDCRYYIFSKTNSISAKVFVEIPYLLQGSGRYLQQFYNNPNAATTSNSSIIIYFDDFADGLYTGRSSPYRNWTCASGTASIDSGGLKHAGGSTTVVTPVYTSLNATSYIADVDVKLNSQGTGVDDPYINIWSISYQDPNNKVRLDTYWDGTYQYFRIRKVEGGSDATVATYTWKNSKWGAGVSHHFKIAYYPPYVTIWIDSTKIFSNVVIPNFTNTLIGFGCIESATATWDNILLRPYLTSFRGGNGVEPALGTLTNENVEISPDSWDDESQELLFTLTSDYLSNCPICFDVVELDADTYETPDVLLKSGYVYNLGFDHVSKYHALRVVVETLSDKTNEIIWNYIRYFYSF